MEVSCCDKLSYFLHYLKYRCSSKKYKSIIVIDKNNTFRDIAESFNYYLSENETFQEPKKILFRCEDERVFNVSFSARTYAEIKMKMKLIIKDYSNYSKKIKVAFPNFIENIYLIKSNKNEKNDNKDNKTEENTEDVEIDIKNMIDECIDYEKNNITFYDVALLLGEKVANISKIKIVYVKMFKKASKEFNFAEYMNNDISVLNSIYE
jgi:hypothetical protein